MDHGFLGLSRLVTYMRALWLPEELCSEEKGDDPYKLGKSRVGNESMRL
jgi:hypothetical protein